MSLYQILCLIGVPSIIVSIITCFVRYIKKMREEGDLVREGVQALLRSEMIDSYNKWKEKGYAPIYARENFDNCYNKYHNLGENGVMDNIKEMFFDLPTEPDSDVNIGKKGEKE